jgi:small subunit ribosomal protein S3e
MESGAKGCEVVVSGKLRAARAKSMKFTVRTLRLKFQFAN